MAEGGVVVNRSEAKRIASAPRPSHPVLAAAWDAISRVRSTLKVSRDQASGAGEADFLDAKIEGIEIALRELARGEVDAGAKEGEQKLVKVAPARDARLDDLVRRVEALEKMVAGTFAPTKTKASYPNVGALIGDLLPAPPKPTAKRAAPMPSETHAASKGTTSTLGKCERALLHVLSERRNMTTTRVQLAILSSYSVESSSFANALGRLKAAAFIAKVATGFRITPGGLAEAGDARPLPKGSALREVWLARLGKAERTMLEALIEAYPNAIDRNELSARTGYSTTSSSFGNAIGRLRALELVNKGWPVSASDVLFDKAAQR